MSQLLPGAPQVQIEHKKIPDAVEHPAKLREHRIVETKFVEYLQRTEGTTDHESIQVAQSCAFYSFQTGQCR